MQNLLSWGSITEVDPLRRSFQCRVMRMLWRICINAALDGSLDRDAARERNRTAVLNDLERRLDGARSPTSRP